MKVVYKRSVGDKIKDEIIKAKEDNKQIEKIVLNKVEWEQLCLESEVFVLNIYMHVNLKNKINTWSFYSGVVVEKDNG